MITIRPGSHIHQLLSLLSVAGEIPLSVLRVLGNERVLTNLIKKLCAEQDIRFEGDGHVFNVKLMQVSGKRGNRTIRLYKKGLLVLGRLHPDALGHYIKTTSGHSFSGSRLIVERNHRVAEALALLMKADIEVKQFALPKLQKKDFLITVPDRPSFYTSRSYKKINEIELKKTGFTRIIGALFYPGGVYAVYNTRGAVMKWSGTGEVKAQDELRGLAGLNAGISEADSALLFGYSFDTAIKTIIESDKTVKKGLRFDRIYNSVHFIPFDKNGVRMLRMLTAPGGNEKLLAALFHNSQRSYNRGSMVYDAIVDGKIVLSHLDGDIARLIRFYDGLCHSTETAEVICFPFQAEFVKTYLGRRANLRLLKIAAAEAALNFRGE